MIYICCGAPRSGSTLQYNIVCEILEFFYQDVRLGYFEKIDFEIFERIISNDFKTPKVIKTHIVEENFLNEINIKKVNFFYIYRDIRDVANSLIKIFNSDFNELIQSNFFADYINFFKMITKSNFKANVFRYENFYPNIKNEILKTANCLNLRISNNQTQQIIENLNIQNIRTEYSSARDFKNGYDPITLFHKNHVYSGDHFTFLNDLSVSQICLLEKLYKPWFIENDYELFF